LELHTKLVETGCGDIELEDFKERYRALADKHEAMISFYDVNIQYNLEELEKNF
jgi:adenylosuccinate synthase